MYTTTTQWWYTSSKNYLKPRPSFVSGHTSVLKLWMIQLCFIQLLGLVVAITALEDTPPKLHIDSKNNHNWSPEIHVSKSSFFGYLCMFFGGGCIHAWPRQKKRNVRKWPHAVEVFLRSSQTKRWTFRILTGHCSKPLAAIPFFWII